MIDVTVVTPSELHTHSIMPCGVPDVLTLDLTMLLALAGRHYQEWSKQRLDKNCTLGLAVLKYSLMGLVSCCRKSKHFCWREKLMGEVLEANTSQEESGHTEKSGARLPVECSCVRDLTSIVSATERPITLGEVINGCCFKPLRFRGVCFTRIDQLKPGPYLLDNMVGYYGPHLADPFSIFKMHSFISRRRDNFHRRLSLQKIGTQKEKD